MPLRETAQTGQITKFLTLYHGIYKLNTTFFSVLVMHSVYKSVMEKQKKKGSPAEAGLPKVVFDVSS